mgnify:CR=1 FL=1
MGMFSRLYKIVNPEKNPDIETVFTRQADHLPTLWLLGKTGAGKSSLIHAVTGDSKIEIGNGFRPCTMTSAGYDFPLDKPVLKFLDTRGLADANYDPQEDIEACRDRSHALIVVMKAEDPEQSSVVAALRQIRKSGKIKQVLLVHTGIELIEDAAERRQCISNNRVQAEKAWGKPVDSVEVDFECEDGTTVGVDALKDKLARMMPILAQLTIDQAHCDLEEKNFYRLKPEVLWYAGAAGASDAVPVAGVFSVPAIQAKMLHSLAGHYGVEWNRRLMAELAGTLGAGFGVQYASKLGVRQIVKLIPVYGQTVGSATAVGVSFCSTYAIGRVACKFIYHKSKGETVSEAEMKAMYKNAFESIRETAENAANDE